jgi:hypothetical protein
MTTFTDAVWVWWPKSIGYIIGIDPGINTGCSILTATKNPEFVAGRTFKIGNLDNQTLISCAERIFQWVHDEVDVMYVKAVAVEFPTTVLHYGRPNTKALLGVAKKSAYFLLTGYEQTSTHDVNLVDSAAWGKVKVGRLWRQMTDKERKRMFYLLWPDTGRTNTHVRDAALLARWYYLENMLESRIVSQANY